MATVFKAFQIKLERYVALKFIHPQLTKQENFRERFEKEAKILARLNHNNIVTIFDYGEYEGQPYLIMEYVEGSSLKGWLADKGKLTLDQAVPILDQVAAALDHAHQQGIIHRDVKPANIMLTPAGRVALSDFGISKLLNDQATDTQTGDTVGTPAYMPPEQIISGVGEVGPASDVYSLGMVAYELLSGKLPYSGQTPAEALVKRLQDPPRPPREIVPEITEEVEKTILKALERNPDDRYPTASAFTKSLAAASGTTDQRVIGETVPAWWPVKPELFSPVPGEAPYKGLQFFDVQDAGLFFGREMLTARLANRLQTERFLVVVGASGSGKSSVVRAGVVPALQGEGTQIAWQIHLITPTAHPLEALATSLTRNSETVLATARLMDELKADPRTLHLYIQKLVQSHQRLLLVVDQFEEIFTLCRDPDERRSFIDNLLTAVSRDGGAISAILTLRADFYHHCARYDELRQALATSQEFIGPMNTQELRQAIETPALNNGWNFEPGLVDLILHDSGADGNSTPEPGALPLLSHALLETWQQRRGKTLTLGGYVQVGGVRGAIAKTAQSVYQGLAINQQTIARDIFLRLTELGEGTQDTRRRISFDELLTGAEDKSEVENVLQILSDARLISMGKNMVDVAHEALIREWSTLRDWLEEDRDGLRIHRHLTKAAEEWQRLDQDPGELYRGARLAQVEAWAQDYGRRLSELERRFLTASRSALIAEEKARVQVRRRARRTPVYSFIGGALGFALSFLLAASPAVENPGLLMVLTVLRLITGGLAGFFLIFLVDLVAPSDSRRSWAAWLWGGIAGSLCFGLLLYFDTLLRVSAANTSLVYSAVAGMAWGFPAGLGRAWMFLGDHRRWQIAFLFAILSGLALMLFSQFRHVLGDTSSLVVFFSGVMVPLMVLAAAYIADPVERKVS